MVNIVEPYARIMDILNQSEGIELLRKIEYCGRISHRSEDTQTDNTWERFITSVVLNHGDWSIVEHASATVDMVVDRGITHELVRHRLFAFTQESTRFVNYEKKMPPSFIRPSEIDTKNDSAGEVWRIAIDRSEEVYRYLIQKGISPQTARSVFPNSLASRIIITGNLRNWRHFLLMRTTKESHPQMREVTIPLLQEFQEKIPLLFDDIESMASQRENLRKPR